ncbi:MAG: GGDEF domain-containing protein [Stenotrophomonas sp.]
MLELLTASGLLVALHDDGDVLRYANAAFRQTFDADPGEAIGWPQMMQRGEARGTGAYAHTDDYAKWLTAAQARRGKQPFRSFEVDLKDGRWLWVTEVIDAQGWMLTVASDSTRSVQGGQGRQARLDRDIALRVARTDELTGALNRRGILGVLDTLVGLLPAEGRHYALALLDLDHFKTVNDEHGHDAGDEVLQKFAQHVHTQMRRSDFFGRYGGEEFLFILPDADAAQAERLLARIRTSLPAVPVSATATVTPQFSAGVIEVNEARLPRELLRCVDQVLYRAKDAGRACTRIGELPPPV